MMDPLQALGLLDQFVSRARLTRDEHAAAAQAVATLGEVLLPKPKAEKPRAVPQADGGV